MKPRRRLVASLSSAVTAVLVLVAWVLFAPPQLGGQTSYVIIDGNSMEPGMHRGDLAIVRSGGTYETGDVVTYRHPEIGPVIHRIIGRDGARYVFQGDNNDFVDGYHPAEQELIGELWLHVPNVGSWLRRFHSPVYLAALLCVAFIGLGGAKAAKNSITPEAPQRPGNQPRSGTANGGGPLMQQLLRNWQDTVSILAAGAIALLGLAWVAFNRPTSHEVPANIPYTQSGEFAYSAATADGRVYDNGAASSGDPVYRRLSDQVAFQFDYEIKTSKAATLSGSYHMIAELGDTNGWKRTIELTPKTQFTGTTVSAAGVLNLAEAQALISVLEEQSGVKNERYSVTVRPNVEVSGAIGGTAFQDRFEAELPMSLDVLQLRMDARNAEQDPLVPASDGSVQTLVREGTHIKLLFVSLPVSVARVASLGGVGLILAFAGWLVMAAVREQAQQQGPFGPRLRSPLVNVKGSVPAPRTRVVDVASLEDLGRIAARLGAVVLQEARPGYHAFFVHDMDITYRYEAIGKSRSGAAAEQERKTA